MSWSEEVALTLINFIQDPDIIRYLLTIAKPIHYDFLLEEARDFHESLRISNMERWVKVKELSKQRKFHQMNSLVPITCTLPFDNGMYNLSRKLMQSIPYFRPAFICRKFQIYEEYCEDVDMELPLKIKTVNRITSKDEEEKFNFMRSHFKRDIDECLSDLKFYEEVQEYSSDYEYYELPYILVEIWHDDGLDGWNRDNNRRYSFKDKTKLFLQEIM